MIAPKNNASGFFSSILAANIQSNTATNIEVMLYLFFMFCRRKGIEFNVEALGKVHQLGREDFKCAPSIEDAKLFDRFFYLFFNFRPLEFSELAKRIPSIKAGVYSIDEAKFEANYCSKVELLVHEAIRMPYGEKSEDIFTQPTEITEVVAEIVKDYGCGSVYNPCSGLAYYGVVLPDDISYYGEEFDSLVELASQVRLDAHGKKNALIEGQYPFREKRKIGKFDAVVSTPPFNCTVIGNVHRYLDDEVALSKHADRLIVEVTVPSWNISQRSTYSRAALCKERKIDKIILLPSNLFESTGVSTEILVIDPRGGKDSITFVDARKMYTGSLIKDRKLDSKAVLEAIHGNGECTISVPYEEVERHSFSLSYEMYKAEKEIPAGECVYSFRRAAGRLTGNQWDDVEINKRLVTTKNLHRSMLDILAHQDETSLNDETGVLARSSWKYFSGHFVAFGIRGGKLGAYIHRGDDQVLCPQTFVVYLVNEDFISMEMFSYYILHNKLLGEFLKAEDGQRDYQNLKSSLAHLEEFGLMLPESPSVRESIYEEHLRTERTIKNEELQAEMNRYGIKSAGADIIHMLGTPFTKQNFVIDYLEANMPEDEMAKEAVSALVDISRYIQRITKNVGLDFDKASFTLKEEDISDVIASYERSWNNFCGDYFNLHVNDQLLAGGIEAKVKLDKDKFFILMDTILDNAYRHGFDKNLDNDAENHNVFIGVSVVHTAEGQFALLRIGNDGRPLEDGFTISDYVSRGRYGIDSGRTGLGGNHIYTIVKRHGGYLGLDGNKNMPFIVRILLPLSNTVSNLLTIDDYEGYI